jgi:hypothetical protein
MHDVVWNQLVPKVRVKRTAPVGQAEGGNNFRCCTQKGQPVVDIVTCLQAFWLCTSGTHVARRDASHLSVIGDRSKTEMISLLPPRDLRFWPGDKQTAHCWAVCFCYMDYSLPSWLFLAVRISSFCLIRCCSRCNLSRFCWRWRSLFASSWASRWRSSSCS